MEIKIGIGADHGGYELKQELKSWLISKSLNVRDFGTNSDKSVDYPLFGHQVAGSVQNNDSDFGILICGSGQGMAITANKYKEIRAALCWDKNIAMLARQHNNANILVLPGRFITSDQAVEITEAFLSTKFEGGRHRKRVEMIAENFLSAPFLQRNVVLIRNRVLKLNKKQRIISPLKKDHLDLKLDV